MKKENQDEHEESISDSISNISAKLYALGELIKFRDASAISIDEDEVNYGIGEILTDLAQELEDIRRALEKTEIDQFKNDKKNKISEKA